MLSLALTLGCLASAGPRFRAVRGPRDAQGRLGKVERRIASQPLLSDVGKEKGEDELGEKIAYYPRSRSTV